MIYTILLSQQADETIRLWKKSNPNLFKKTSKLLIDIAQHPRSGLGKPEPLIGGRDLIYSRHITGKERIIYNIDDDIITVIVVQVGKHYNDK